MILCVQHVLSQQTNAQTPDPLLEAELALLRRQPFGSLSLRQQETARLNQLLTLRRQQETFRARQEAQRRAKERRLQEQERLRLLRQQQEALRRRENTLQQSQFTNADLLQTRAQILQDQALLGQTQLRTSPAGQYIPILEDDRDGPFQDGTYYFSFATGDGILREEGARLTGPYTHEVTGSYSYTAPNGELIIMEYIADENGYRAFPVRPGRPSVVRRPEPIPVPPPFRTPLPQFQGPTLSTRALANPLQINPQRKRDTNTHTSPGTVGEDLDFQSQ
ncbi:hypothetical protein Pcinc_024761 [Petrolisthes cinctipes]|uniref:Uncharacterized protein n=1 Tax=Petrolisthes cinctipes TaxID=88211 RepID=A0AAE1FAK8_PETCI|nr:hypothetical protein Pcinc_024761 [Petrolisthes cinctipes]